MALNKARERNNLFPLLHIHTLLHAVPDGVPLTHLDSLEHD
jgi:hypothetical protein